MKLEMVLMRLILRRKSWSKTVIIKLLSWRNGRHEAAFVEKASCDGPHLLGLGASELGLGARELAAQGATMERQLPIQKTPVQEGQNC